ncbi:CHAT domain-containing protein [Spirosoma harenae]
MRIPFFLLGFLISISVLAQPSVPDQLIQQFQERYNAGEFTKALSIAQRLASLYERNAGRMNPEYAHALGLMANTYESLGEYDQALLVYRECLTIREKTLGKQSKDYIITQNNLAMLFVNMGRYDEALPLYQQANVGIERLIGKNNSVYAMNLNNIAGLYQKTGLYDKALTLYEQAATSIEQALGKQDPSYAICLGNVANVMVEMGQYDQALPRYQESLSITKKSQGENHPAYAFSLDNLAGLYTSMGQYDNALRLYNQSLQILARTLGQGHPDYARGLNNLADLYGNMGQHEKALPLFQKSLTMTALTVGKQHPDYAIGLSNVASAEAKLKAFKQAVPLHTEALSLMETLYGSSNQFTASVLNDLAVDYMYLDQYESALAAFQKSLSITERTIGKQHPEYINRLNNLALLYSRHGQTERAVSLLTDASRLSRNQYLRDISVLSEQAISQYRQKTDASYFSYSLQTTNPRLALAGINYNEALISKGVSLLATQQLQQQLSNTTDTSISKRYETFLLLKSQLGELYSKGTARRTYIDSLERRIAALDEELRLNVPDYKKAFEALRVEWPQVQQKLRPDEAAIEFVHFTYWNKRPTDSTYYAALVLRPGWKAPRMVFLCEERQLDKLLMGSSASAPAINEFYRGGVVGVTNQQQLTGGQALSRLIWQPLAPLLVGVRSLVVSASGRLHQIALAALPNLADASKRTCLADRFDFQQVGSTRSIALRGNEPAALLSTRSLSSNLYGGIVYDSDSTMLTRQPRANSFVSHRIGRGTTNRLESWIYLPGTKTEVEGLGKLLPAPRTTTIMGLSATEGSIKALSGHSPAVLHIATHGFFFPDLVKSETGGLGVSGAERTPFEQAENPLFRSGLIMAGANYVWKGGTPIQGVDDGILTAYEVSGLDLKSTYLVVLSACETGLGKVLESEGVYGLQRAFQIAGADKLLVSLWRVSDVETAQYMQLFYQQLLKTRSAPQAYRFAQKQMRTLYPKEPYKWAAFVLIE